MKGKNKSNVKCWIFLFLQPNSEPKSFTFDGVYGTNSTTEAIYNDNGFDLVEVKKNRYDYNISIQQQQLQGVLKMY